MTRSRTTLFLTALLIALFLFNLPSFSQADEKTITLKGRVDASGLKVATGPFRVSAIKPQDPKHEMGQATSDSSGRFQVTLEEEDVAVYGVLLRATSTKAPSVVLEAVVLRLKEAREPIPVTATSTVESALLAWKVRKHPNEFRLIRPNWLYIWLEPMLLSKTRKGLHRAELALAQWAQGAAGSNGLTTAGVLQAGVGDLRFIRERLAAAKVPEASIAQVEKMMKDDPNVAYLLMMPYVLEL
jgi:hypothetical protein